MYYGVCVPAGACAGVEQVGHNPEDLRSDETPQEPVARPIVGSRLHRQACACMDV